MPVYRIKRQIVAAANEAAALSAADYSQAQVIADNLPEEPVIEHLDPDVPVGQYGVYWGTTVDDNESNPVGPVASEGTKPTETNPPEKLDVPYRADLFGADINNHAHALNRTNADWDEFARTYRSHVHWEGHDWAKLRDGSGAWFADRLVAACERVGVERPWNTEYINLSYITQTSNNASVRESLMPWHLAAHMERTYGWASMAWGRPLSGLALNHNVPTGNAGDQITLTLTKAGSPPSPAGNHPDGQPWAFWPVLPSTITPTTTTYSRSPNEYLGYLLFGSGDDVEVFIVRPLGTPGWSDNGSTISVPCIRGGLKSSPRAHSSGSRASVPHYIGSSSAVNNDEPLSGNPTRNAGTWPAAGSYMLRYCMAFWETEGLKALADQCVMELRGIVSWQQITGSSAANDTLTCNNHGYTNGQEVVIAGYAIPNGIQSLTPYYVVQAQSGTFKLSKTPGGVPVDIVTGGSTTDCRVAALARSLPNLTAHDIWGDVSSFFLYNHGLWGHQAQQNPFMVRANMVMPSWGQANIAKRVPLEAELRARGLGGTQTWSNPPAYGQGSATLTLNVGGSNVRTCYVRYPTGGDSNTPRPLIILGHGFGGDPSVGINYFSHLTSRGYIVAMLEYTGTFSPPTYANQASVAITRLINKDFVTGSLPSSLSVDDTKIAAAGTSQGAMMALCIGKRTANRDPRVKGIYMRVGSHHLIGSTGWEWDNGVPVYMLNGTADNTVAPSNYRNTYSLLGGPKILVDVTNMDHFLQFNNTGTAHPNLGNHSAAAEAFFDGVFRGKPSGAAEVEAWADQHADKVLSINLAGGLETTKRPIRITYNNYGAQLGNNRIDQSIAATQPGGADGVVCEHMFHSAQLHHLDQLIRLCAQNIWATWWGKSYDWFDSVFAAFVDFVAKHKHVNWGAFMMAVRDATTNVFFLNTLQNAIGVRANDNHPTNPRTIYHDNYGSPLTNPNTISDLARPLGSGVSLFRRDFTNSFHWLNLSNQERVVPIGAPGQTLWTPFAPQGVEYAPVDGGGNITIPPYDWRPLLKAA